MRTIGRFISFLLGVGWFLFMFATPALGVWLASSLVCLHGGPRELALFGGVLLFPVLPVAWELRATSAWKKKVGARKQLGAPPKRALTAVDRLVLRTLFVNLAFLAALLVWFPKTAFTALATRGDWFISERHQPWADDLRKVLFASASGLEWLHELANPNPYKQQGDDAPVPSSVTPVEDTRQPVVRRWPRPPGAPDAGAVAEAPAADAGALEPVQATASAANPDATWTVGDTVWPYQPKVHPVVAAMTAADEGSIEAVATYIAARERDPFQRVKALHDWVVTRLRYDEASLDDRRRKPQDAQAVFASRLGVCEGYARLLVELGKHTGDPIVYVVGEVREENGGVASVGHAWNAVELQGRWYLLDATWDDPVMSGGPKRDVYSTDYLFIPPSVAIFDHLPEQQRWQLLPTPLSRGDFLRQPFARPGLAREGLVLRTPQRSSVEVRDSLELALDNPRRLFVSAKLTGSGQDVECGVDDGATVSLHCPVPAAGRYEARLFTNRERYGTYASVASIEVLSK